MIGRVMAVGMLLAVVAATPSCAQAIVPSSVYTRPQRLIPVDGARRLNLYCAGTGSPTVLLEAGAGNSMMTWRLVQAEIAHLTRVCAYDRAGLGFSDAATRPSNDANMADDLHRLIKAAHIATPIVFVGHSLGGEVGLFFAAHYPAELAGAVLVDPGFPGMLRVLQAALPPGDRTALLDGFRKMLDANRTCLALARQGALLHPATNAAKDCVDPDKSPGRLDDTLRKATMRELAVPHVWRAMISEAESFVPQGGRASAGVAELDAANLSFGDKPLIVLTRGNQEGAPGVPPDAVAAMEEAWKAAHDRLAVLSQRGVSVVVPHTGHYIQIDQPGAVIDAIRQMVADLCSR
jgi:pimeloyl-ACP methyl ester carboxylesterase